MKKLTALLMIAALTLGLCACGADKTPEAGAPMGEQGAPAQAQSAAIENRVALSIDKTAYEREERIEVTLDFDRLDKSAAVIVIVPTDREHGSEAAVHDDYEEYRYLADFSETPFYLWAPAVDGLFDVRVYASSEGGDELASIAIAVGGAMLPAASQAGGASAGAALSGGDGVSTYAGAYKKYEAVYSAMGDAYSALIYDHNTAIEEKTSDYWNDPNHFSDVVNCFLNIPIAYTATLGEGDYRANVELLFNTFGFANGQLEELSATSYRMTYLNFYNDPVTWESTENAPWESVCGFDAERGALYFRQYVTLNGEKKLDSFIEFVPLGGGRYALQSAYERGIVELLNGEATAFDYAAYNDRFDPDADAIFPDAATADAAWITAGSDMYQHITLNADSLHIWAAAIPDGIMAAPERDITIDR